MQIINKNNKAYKKCFLVFNFLKNEFGLEDDQLRLESGGQVIRGTRQAANDLDRRVEVRAERR